MDIPWLFDPCWAKVSVILVSVWLTIPYFFLVSLGALQSIPGELVEAARVDGAGAVAGLPPGHAAAAARRRRAAADRVVRLQLQQLQQHLPADRRRPGRRGPVGRRRHRHPDQLHVQARVRSRARAATSGSRAAISIIIFFIVGDDLGDLGFWRTKALENIAMTASSSSRSSSPTRCRARRVRRRRFRPSSRDTWWRHVVAIVAVVFALFPVVYIVSAAFNGDHSLSGASLIPRTSRSTTSARILLGQRPSSRGGDVPTRTTSRGT